MTTNFDNYKTWYVQILDDLSGKRDAGIAVLIISLPLLERYLRRKHKLAPEDNMTDAAMNGLCAMFPSLGSISGSGASFLERLSQWVPSPSNGIQEHQRRRFAPRWLADSRHRRTHPNGTGRKHYCKSRTT